MGLKIIITIFKLIMKHSEIKNKLSHTKKSEIDQAFKRLLKIKRIRVQKRFINAISFGYMNIYKHEK